jgi:predicted ATPase
VAPQRLPVSATPLVGRAREVVLLRQLLLDGDVRAVTITGPAGVGKIPLAIEVAAALAPDFAGQVHRPATFT